jgi:hypothetical protein
MTTTQAGLEFSQKPEMELIEEVCDKQSPVDEELVEGTEEERKLLWKIDLYLMPAIWVLYLFSYMVSQVA